LNDESSLPKVGRGSESEQEISLAGWGLGRARVHTGKDTSSPSGC